MSELTDLSEKQAGNVAGKRTLKTILKKEWQLIVKILELLFCVLCIALVMEPAKKGDLAVIHFEHFAFIFTTFIGYTLITSIIIVARIIGDKFPYRTGFIFAMLASGLFFLSGILLAIDRKNKYFHDDIYYEPRPHILNLLAASSAFSFLSSLIFTVDAVYAWKYRKDF